MALVAGANKGIGKQVARQLAASGVGAYVRRGYHTTRCSNFSWGPPTPTAMRPLGSDGVAPVLFPVSPRSASRPPARFMATLAEQTVEVCGIAESGRVIAQVAQRRRPGNATAVAVTFEESSKVMSADNARAVDRPHPTLTIDRGGTPLAAGRCWTRTRG